MGWARGPGREISKMRALVWPEASAGLGARRGFLGEKETPAHSRAGKE